MGDRVEAVFSALADPSRRFVVERLAASGTATPTELAGELPVSRQAVAKHLASLEAAGLVHGTRVGRNTVYRLDTAPLSAAAEWIARVGAEWDQRLAALAAHVGRQADRDTPDRGASPRESGSA
jgi:DNA-binding transcriptional ArsR family regulator